MTKSKKVIKTVLLVLMLVGIVITAINFSSSNLHSGTVGKLVTYYAKPADCRGLPKDCYDFTSTNPDPNPSTEEPTKN